MVDRLARFGQSRIARRTPLVCSGKALQVGFVEAVATEASQRRRDHGARLMRRIGELIREEYPLGALPTGTHGFYTILGWSAGVDRPSWTGPMAASARQPTMAM